MKDILERLVDGEINIDEAERLINADNILEFNEVAKFDSNINEGLIVFYVNVNTRDSIVNERDSDDDFALKKGEIDSILNAVNDDLANANYFSASLNAVEEIASAAKPGFFSTVWAWLLIALGGSGIATRVGVGSHKKVTRIGKRHYMKDGKPVTVKKDDVYTHTTTETKKNSIVSVLTH